MFSSFTTFAPVDQYDRAWLHARFALLTLLLELLEELGLVSGRDALVQLEDDCDVSWQCREWREMSYCGDGIACDSTRKAG
jgi:hypothetical protein